jgi:hypothetical protein
MGAKDRTAALDRLRPQPGGPLGSSPSTPAPWRSPHEPDHHWLAGPPHATGPRREAGSPHSGFDRALVRRLAVLKNWVDQHGLSSPPAVWRPAIGAISYDPDRWQTTRRAADFDEDSIGILAVPPPSLDALGDQLRTHFGFLAHPDSTERRIVAGGAGSRNLVLKALSSLPGSRFASRPLY